jgi:hypothetical protein
MNSKSNIIYFQVPDVDVAHQVVDKLLLARIPEESIHVIAREGTALESLPEPSLTKGSDVVPAVERGLTAGGAAGLLAGLIAVAFPPAGIILGGGTALALTLAGAGLGAVFSSLIGVSLPNSELSKFQEAIDQGHVLILVEAGEDKAHEVEQIIRTEIPQVELHESHPKVRTLP